MSLRHQAAARFWVEVVCHNCARSGAGQFFQRRVPITALSKDAQKNGWRLRMDGEFECPSCWKEVKGKLQAMLHLNSNKETGHGDDA